MPVTPWTPLAFTNKSVTPGPPYLSAEFFNTFQASLVDTQTEVNTVEGLVNALNAAEILTRLKTVDGNGSGLDADLLRGQTPASLISSSAADILTAIKTVDGSGSGLDADTLDGHDTAYFIPASDRGATNGVASLVSGKIPTTQIPALAINDTTSVATQAAMLALTAERGDMAIRTDFDPDRTYILAGDDPTVLANWVRVTFGDVVSVFGRTGVVGAQNGDYTASQITNVAAGELVSVTVQAVINELAQKKLTFGDFYSDLVVSGAVPSTSANLTTTTPQQTLYVGSNRQIILAEPHTYGASTTTYIDVTPAGAFVYTTSAAPTAGNLRAFSVVTSGTAITAVNDLRPRSPFELLITGLKLSITASGGSGGTRGANGDHIQLSAGQAWIPSLNRIYNVPVPVNGPTLAFSASTWYHFYIYDASGVPTLDISTTAPVIYKDVAAQKTGDNSRRYVGSRKTDASGVLYKTRYEGDWIFYDVGMAANAPFGVVSNGNSATAATISCSAVVPVTSTSMHAGVYNVGNQAVLFSNLNIGTITTGVYWQQMSAGVYSGLPLLLDSSQQFQYMYNAAPSSGGLYVVVLGFKEKR